MEIGKTAMEKISLIDWSLSGLLRFRIPCSFNLRHVTICREIRNNNRQWRRLGWRSILYSGIIRSLSKVKQSPELSYILGSYWDYVMNMTNKHIMIMIFLIFIINQIYLPLSHSEIQSKNDSPKIIIIRADDISTTNPGIRWLSDVVIEKNIQQLMP